MEAPAEDAPPPPSRKPKYTKLTQQQLPACQPVLDPVWIIFIFLSISIVFIPIGGVCYAYGLKAKEIVYQYDKHLPADNSSVACTAAANNKEVQQHIWKVAAQNGDVGPSCHLRVRLSGTWTTPIYVYYQLERFYQNHRRYHKSRSDGQLADEDDPDLKTCKPKQTYNGENILPCGLIAWSYFNDSYTVVNDSKNLGLRISGKNIAPKADVKERFASIMPKNFYPENVTQRGGGNITTTLKRDERFVLWMRTAALPRFRKLWGRIDFDGELRDIDLLVNITNQYNSYDFDGTKSLVFATTTWLGGRTRFLGIGYLVTGGTSLLMAAVYAVLYAIKKPSLDDARLLLSS